MKTRLTTTALTAGVLLCFSQTGCKKGQGGGNGGSTTASTTIQVQGKSVLTEEEKRAWNDLLLCAWIDEALWLLKDDQQGWFDARQSQLLLSLLLTDLSTLALPA